MSLTKNKNMSLNCYMVYVCLYIVTAIYGPKPPDSKAHVELTVNVVLKDVLSRATCGDDSMWV